MFLSDCSDAKSRRACNKMDGCKWLRQHDKCRERGKESGDKGEGSEQRKEPPKEMIVEAQQRIMDLDYTPSGKLCREPINTAKAHHAHVRSFQHSHFSLKDFTSCRLV